MFKQIYGAFGRKFVPLPSVGEIIKFTRKAGWSIRESSIRQMHRGTKAKVEAWPRLRGLPEWEVPPLDEVPPAATPIRTAFQYEFTLMTRYKEETEFSHKTFKFRADELMSAKQAGTAFQERWGSLFEKENVKWQTLTYMGVSKRTL